MSEPFDAPPEDQWLAANRAIASAMAHVLARWSVRAPGATGRCSAWDRGMARAVFAAFGREATDDDVDLAFASFVARYGLMGVTIGLPRAARAAELLTSYGFGRFVMTCAQRGLDLRDLPVIERAIDDVAREMWAVDGVIAFYETSSGGKFPAEARPVFASVVGALRSVFAAVPLRVPRPRASDVPDRPTRTPANKRWN
jgi:hypothetical protein